MDLGPPRADRRRVLSWLLGGSASALLTYVVYPVIRFVSPPPIPEASTHQAEVGLTNDPELQEKGYKIVRFGEEPVILVRVSGDDLRAFTATCTHLDCIVEYQKEAKRIWCNCHNGQYDLSGHVVAGPPPRPLERLRVDLVAREAGGPRAILVSRA